MKEKFQENDSREYRLKWLPILSLALSLPSSILVTSFVAKALYEAKILSKTLSYSLVFLITFQTIIVMVVYAFRKKNKS